MSKLIFYENISQLFNNLSQLLTIVLLNKQIISKYSIPNTAINRVNFAQNKLLNCTELDQMKLSQINYK